MQPVQLDGDPRPPEAWENGRQGHRDRLPGPGHPHQGARSTKPGQFVWHCHIVEHEDNEMMRPYRIGPVQPGEPGGLVADDPVEHPRRGYEAHWT